MRQSKHFIRLDEGEIEFLKKVIGDHKSSKTRKSKAEILLELNGRRPSYTIIDHLAYTHEVSKSLVTRLISLYEKEGVEAIKKSPNSTPRRHYKVPSEIKEKILAWIQSPPPKDKHKWSAYAIADKIVEDGLAKKYHTRQSIVFWSKWE